MKDERYNRYLKVKEEFWQVPYLGRKVNDKYYSVFDQNGYYPSDEEAYPEYAEKGLILNLKPYVVDGVIKDISYYKVADHGLYSRHRDDKPLTACDKKAFTLVLDQCTDSIAADVLDKLIAMPLKEGWEVSRVSEKSVSLKNGDEKVSLPTDYAKTVIDIARNYPDIANNEDFWTVNAKELKEKYRHAVFALLVNFDSAHFPDVQFGETASGRIAREDAAERAEKGLLDALDHNDLAQASRYAEQLINVPSKAIEAAINKDATDVLQFFIKKASEKELKEIGSEVIHRHKTDLFKQLVEERAGDLPNDLVYEAYNNGCIDYVTLLLENGFTLNIRANNPTEYEAVDLLSLVEYREVIWPVKWLEKLYREEGGEPIKRILDNYHSDWDRDKQTFVNGYGQPDKNSIIEWLIDTGDYELMEYAAQQGIYIATDSGSDFWQEGDLLIKAFNAGEDFWKHAKALFKDDKIQCAKLYSRCVSHEKDLDLLRRLIKYTGIGTGDDDLLTNCAADDAFVRVLVENYDPSRTGKLSTNEPIWKRAFSIRDLTSFRIFFSKFNDRINEDLKTEIQEYFIWRRPDPAKATILVEECGFPESLVQEAKLAVTLGLGKALLLAQTEFNKSTGQNVVIPEHRVLIKYYDGHSWEVKGLPSTSKYDKLDLTEFHYIVSVDGSDNSVRVL